MNLVNLAFILTKNCIYVTIHQTLELCSLAQTNPNKLGGVRWTLPPHSLRRWPKEVA